MSAEVMALANSSLYRGREPVTTMTRAILALGLEHIHAMAITIAMQAFRRAAADSEENRNSWRHSLTCAFAAEELAGAYRQPGDGAYVMGLMHDVGRFGLISAYPALTAGAFGVAYPSNEAVLAGERQAFGMDHCQAGYWLMQAWGLPAEFQAAAAHHHGEEAARETGAVGLIHASCRLADAMGMEAVRKHKAESLEDIALALPPRAAAHNRLEQVRERVRVKFELLDSSLNP
jgi:HD-like signal output (HDOD) protein